MGHKSWGGARPNKWDIYQHQEPEGSRFYVTESTGGFAVYDSEQDLVVFNSTDKDEADMECELLNSLEQA